jgi:hypothetical protein
VSHVGNLDTYFDGRTRLKNAFLRHLHKLLDDGVKRFFVAEVNSSDEDLASIVKDLVSARFIFQSKYEQYAMGPVNK